MLSALWKVLVPGLGKILPGVKDVIEVVAGNRKERDRNEHDEQIAIHEADAAGYSYKAANRTWFDVAIDGLNRMPRPLFAFWCMGLLTWPIYDPERFSVTMRAMATIPDMLWTVIAMVLAFFFGSRTLAKDLSKGASDQASRNAQQYFDTAAAKRGGGSAEPMTGGRGAAGIAEDWRRKAMQGGGG